MTLRDIAPRFLIDYVKLILIRRKYPGARIDSPWIAPGVVLGNGCSIASGVSLGPKVSIGKFSYVNSGTSVGSATIGKFCSIAHNCQIGMAEHPTDFISTSPYTYDEDNIFGFENLWHDIYSPPIVENDVWIGSNTTIIQGIKIMNGAIIAAGAVVTKDVPPYAIVGGVPAKIIKYRFPPDAINYLLNMQWWDLEDSELIKYKELFFSGRKWQDITVTNSDK